MKMDMQVKLIFISMVSHKDSFLHRGKTMVSRKWPIGLKSSSKILVNSCHSKTADNDEPTYFLSTMEKIILHHARN